MHSPWPPAQEEMELRQVWSFLDCRACAKNLRVALTVEAAPNNLHHQGHKRTFNTLAYYRHSPPDWNWGMTDSKCSNDLKNCGLAGLEDLRWPHSHLGGGRGLGYLLTSLSLSEPYFIISSTLCFFSLPPHFPKCCCHIYLH